jgi:NADP-dependent 3-hydroxy acid dehydrogenase YdfG
MGESARPVALVTGASGGIGAAVARRLARSGFALALSGRRKERLEALAGACGTASVHIADLGREGAPAALLNEVLEQHRRLDLLVNNAGIGGGGDVLHASAAAWERALTVNLGAAMQLCHAAMPALRRSPRGCVIQIASISAQHAYAGGEAYGASKAGLVAFSRCLFESVREDGVKVCAVLPGYVDTEMATGEGLDRSKMLQPDDVADAVAYVVSASASCCPTEIVLRPQRAPYLRG